MAKQRIAVKSMPRAFGDIFEALKCPAEAMPTPSIIWYHICLNVRYGSKTDKASGCFRPILLKKSDFQLA
ncbi:hypothetical protein [Pseudomonas sp. QD4]|uniref:hypothetical protein n=1 Tax=Pseudomonas sp. QD4 TaxID=3368618 RepID=UPI003BA369F4